MEVDNDQLSKAIIEVDPFKTTRGVAEEVNIDHVRSFVIREKKVPCCKAILLGSFQANTTEWRRWTLKEHLLLDH
ncbi:hypothetical protein KIN20_036660 [Parelaphostrongylus tenuis]|uniref:Uncharacterized protein n=1 Tax=Parelaphostrongylus tenuis TaxID=148309 RepID=A0AAD5RDC5_PARTN|nr:hypothetical protein KIN20_036660 [Parelaphostrongylus tenuis]